ncbi:MAG: adenosylcobinamide-phosphate synthase CbiB [Phycisphaerae bacterium]|nr:adenosylcobinamide-phosphate synthase CbiB [Phycisphaerae bacterium]
MRLEYQILIAAGADLLLGDPRWLPHPVRGIGWLAARMETLTRWAIRPARLAGIVAAVGILGIAGGAAWGLIRLADLAHPIAADVVAIALLYTTIAARDLARHSMAVFRRLARGDLDAARKAVAMIVGRDTDRLDEAGVARAAVESVAESTVDGVTAPLFFAILFGPIGAIVYRAANTLDSMFGHKDERYREFGWASARIDDVLNFIPARLTGPLVCVVAAMLGQRPVNAARVLVRDGRKHDSPNAGLAEAAMAGALGVQVGGVNCYNGEPLEKPTIGDAILPLSARHIPWANALMFATAGVFLALGLSLRVVVTRLL